jgi:hypothetical protein
MPRIMFIVCGGINKITHKGLIMLFCFVSIDSVEFWGEKVMVDSVAPE